jgi:preprotein translocase SecE subunit
MPTKKKGSDTDKATSSESAKPQSSANSQPGGKENTKAKGAPQNPKEEKAKDKSGTASTNAKADSQKGDKKPSGNQSTKPKAKAKDGDGEEGSIAATTTDIIQFLKEVDIERRKISWPEPSQVVRETWSVLFLVTVITTLVLSFDWAVGHFVFNPLEHWARLNGGGIGRP